jgi:hypothetical protein
MRKQGAGGGNPGLEPTAQGHEPKASASALLLFDALRWVAVPA